MDHVITIEDLNNALNQLTREETLSLRSQYIPKACKLHFEKSPMKVLRASAQYLYDDGGNEYLDCVNCVAHVGHCNPIVVEAAKTAMFQMGSVVHDGTSDLAEEYVSKLKTTFPPEIDTFLFVASGSEANDLAIQMARMYTGNFDVVSVDRSFHGGGLSLPNSVSPRQFSNEERCPDWVHVVDCPDFYRGKYREYDEKGVEKYCKNANQVMEEAVRRQRKLACFICEPLMTVAGVIVPPSEWLHSVYNNIRQHGGLAIADETQSGLGRSGTGFWCFQLFDNLVPDIITIGKPLGNGYPMACVATRREIASVLSDQFQNHLSCDLVSAAVGLAVLNTVWSLSLQLNARKVGDFLREGIRSLGATHQNIGQVRGTGLMIGVEIVYNEQSRKPAREIAERICYKMLEHFIIVANDGPHKNVLIFTPPMCFTCENAHRVIIALGKILKEIEENSWSDTEEDSSSVRSSISGERLLSLEELTNLTAEDGNAGEGESINDSPPPPLPDVEIIDTIGGGDGALMRRPSFQNISPGTILSSGAFLDELILNDDEDDDGGYATSNSFASMD